MIPTDAVNLLFVARKTGTATDEIAADPAEVMQAMNLMALYQRTRAKNLTALKGAPPSNFPRFKSAQGSRCGARAGCSTFWCAKAGSIPPRCRC
jgi:hypothetical protein